MITLKKWSLRLLLVVLAVVTCSFIFRSTEDAENDYGSLDQLDPEEMLLYEEAKTMTENYLSMTGMHQEEYTILDYAENSGKGRLSMVVLYRDNRSGVESNILFSEERGVGEVTVGIGLPLHYYANDGGFFLKEPDVICVSFHNEATGQIYDYRLTYTWHEESDGPMISNDERIRDAQ